MLPYRCIGVQLGISVFFDEFEKHNLWVRDLYRYLQEAGDPEGSWLLAWRYKLGEGTSQSDETADSLFEIAAKRGHEVC